MLELSFGNIFPKEVKTFKDKKNFLNKFRKNISRKSNLQFEKRFCMKLLFFMKYCIINCFTRNI